LPHEAARELFVTENLPIPAGAKLPTTYQAAKKALAECTRVDECKDWADKAAAMASYARQRDDQSLHNLAQRIQLRAIRRIGELSKQLGIEQPRDQSGRLASSGKTAKSAVLRTAGVSTSAAHRAERVACIPEEEFEEALASATPPTVTALAERGKVSRPAVPEPAPVPADRSQVTAAYDQLRRFAAFCGTHDAARIACAPSVDGDLFRGLVETIDSWLDRFVAHLPADKAA
jgi:hypothetical protein